MTFFVEGGCILEMFRPFEDLQDLGGHQEANEMPIWRSCDFWSVTIRFVSENYPKSPEVQLSTTFGQGVNVSVKIFGLEFGPKAT